MNETTIAVGDTVRVGSGKTHWVVQEFWGHDNAMAQLRPVGGYSPTSVQVERLVLVEKAST